MVDRIPRATDTDGLLLGDLAPGIRVGEYVVEYAIPTRGSGHVYEAIHRLLPRRVRLEVMPAAPLDLPNEAYLVDLLDHPGIPRIYECGFLGDRRPWIATELVEGISAATLLETGCTLADAAAIVRDVATILEHVHAHGLVHRNVTPRAIVIPDAWRQFPICLLDWSGARACDSRAPLPFRVPSRYVAPEIHIDDRTDIFALGAVARELLHTTEPAARPPIFSALIKAMTADDPAARPSAYSVREHAMWLVEEITRAHENEPAIPRPVAVERTEVVSTRMVTSELTSVIAGEIDS